MEREPIDNIMQDISQLVNMMEDHVVKTRKLVEGIRYKFRQLCQHDYRSEDSLDGTVHVCRHCGRSE